MTKREQKLKPLKWPNEKCVSIFFLIEYLFVILHTLREGSSKLIFNFSRLQKLSPSIREKNKSKSIIFYTFMFSLTLHIWTTLCIIGQYRAAMSFYKDKKDFKRYYLDITITQKY